MVFQPIGRTACDVTITAGELLPRLFTLTLRLAQGGYFLLRYQDLTALFPLGKMVLFVARTFLSAQCATMDRPTAMQSYEK
jgi:hypothetical protein